MKRIFVYHGLEYTRKTVVDTQTGDVYHYTICGGIVLSEYSFNVLEDGWKSVKEFMEEKYRWIQYQNPCLGIKRAGWHEADYRKELRTEKVLIIAFIAQLLQRQMTENNLEEIKTRCAYMTRYGMSPQEALAAAAAQVGKAPPAIEFTE